ncbi:MAG: hypothetical protein QMC89_03090 [Candidatus Hodarchaeaceae archaeon]|nr:hypothetical protein [Candidatus Hodarchaeaceae archaeon]
MWMRIETSKNITYEAAGGRGKALPLAPNRFRGRLARERWEDGKRSNVKCPHCGSELVIRAGKLRNKYVTKQGTGPRTAGVISSSAMGLRG